ncbi:MAG: hypothetical protein U5K79_18105 [Cyclobacteriaceae bacterium]|nr:hypothetical protein [Cyclobacteriaceae bacterium]
MSEQLTFSVWLGNTGGIDDNSILEFETGGVSHGNQTYFIGSQFGSTLATVTSNQFETNVVADRLNIISYSSTISKQ